MQAETITATEKVTVLKYPTTEEAALRWTSQRTDPLHFPKKVLDVKTLWWGAEDIITSIFTHRKVAIQSGHSMSKDWAAGIIVLAWLLRYWGKAKVIVTAPTGRQVKDVMFGEIAKQYDVLRTRFPEFKKEWLTSTKLTFGPECFALGFTTKDTGEMVGKFSGFKSPNILIIVSEAQAVSSSVYKQIRGLMASENSKILELGNPLMPFGDFFQHCTNPRFGYKVIKLSCFQSPNVVKGYEKIPGMMTMKSIKEDFQDELGPGYEDDPEYQSRVLGEFPTQSAYAWIPLQKIREAVGRTFPSDTDIITVGGLDTAREGNDETVHCVFKGKVQIKQDCFKKVLTPATVAWAKGLIIDQKVEALAVDEGYNPGILDWLAFDEMPVFGIKFGGESPNPRFADFGTYMWWLLRRAFMMDDIGIMDDMVLIYQLSSRRIERNLKGKLKIESKKKITKRGEASPDRGDAMIMAWYARLMVLGELGSIVDDFPTESSGLQASLDQVDEGQKRAKMTAKIHLSEDDDIASIEMDSAELEF